jgi:hypothetical protein
MKNAKLVLHCGATEVARTDLSNIVMPEATETYMPIGHAPFLDMVQDKIGDIGFAFGPEAHSLTKEGKRYFGLVQLVAGTEADSDEFALVMGVRNSVDKSFPASIIFGSSVFVCDNLAFSGEIKITRKHTKHIWRDLPGLIGSAVSQTKLMADNQERRFEAYRETKLNDWVADHLIMDMYRNGALNTQRIGPVSEQWYEPAFDHGPRTIWRLFNACTQVLKESSLIELPNRTMLIQAVLDTYSKFVPKRAQLELPIEGEAVRVN